MPKHNSSQASFPWLVADIGGSNARFGWLPEAGCQVQDIRSLPVARHGSPALATRSYLEELAGSLGSAYIAPRNAAYAVATAVAGEDFELTNSSWTFSRSEIRSELSLDGLLVLNDFEALALSIPRLGTAQLRAHGALPCPHGTLAVIGPGTGLGVAGAVETPSGWVALAGEGGHVTLAAADDFEGELLARVREEFPHVSAERLLSGIGLPVLHQALASLEGARVDIATAEEIVKSGVSRNDALCSRTLDVFCAMLGSFAGNVALTFGARGGIYIGGGIVPRLGDRFFESRFRERFEAKGRRSAYLRNIPTALITDTLAALTGAAVALEHVHA